ncbi:hypothetical protein JB92DRAFT_2831247 [Gautieria morchelliformis]|nr:hypothetical protein JB92DRAFT_2831247 [Gautieria morchelliformis]
MRHAHTLVSVVWTRAPRRRAAQPYAPGGVRLRTDPTIQHPRAASSKLADVLPHPRHGLPSHSVEVFTALATDHAPTPCPVRHSPWPRHAHARAKDVSPSPHTHASMCHVQLQSTASAPAPGLDSHQKFSHVPYTPGGVQVRTDPRVEVFTALATDHAPTPCPVRHGPWPRPARARAKDYGLKSAAPAPDLDSRQIFFGVPFPDTNDFI